MLDTLIVKYIKDQAREHLNSKDDQQLEEVWTRLHAIFLEWKMEHGDKRAKYKIVEDGLSIFRVENRITSFEDALPWECARLKLPSQIGLAFKLEREKYPRYMEFMKEIGRSLIFALLIERGNKPFSDVDLFFAYELMVREKLALAILQALSSIQPRVRAGKTQLQNLRKGNPAAAKKKRERSLEYHETWRKWALEYWKKAPSWKRSEDALAHVCALAAQHGHKMSSGKPYSVNTIDKIIAGVKSTLKTHN
jgi:hypothetical protein